MISLKNRKNIKPRQNSAKYQSAKNTEIRNLRHLCQYMWNDFSKQFYGDLILVQVRKYEISSHNLELIRCDA